MITDREADALSARLTDLAVRAAREAGAFIVQHAGRVEVAAEKRGFFDPVTECDRQSERMISEMIFAEHPDSTIVGEEGGKQGDGAVHWYVDPIDGTNNFVAGLPYYCVSIAAAVDDYMLAGVVYDPTRDECFAASRAGAMLNGQPIRSRGSADDTGATLLTGFPKAGALATPDDHARFATLVASFRAVRRMGSTALHLAYVACGRADATFEIRTNAWDLAAGMFLVQQAGGQYHASREPGVSAERPWLSPSFIASCPEFDLGRSSLRPTVWDGLIATPA
jgi:myo-inositol-1(or 4)-monophosphatase